MYTSAQDTLTRLFEENVIGGIHCKNRIMRSAANDFSGNPDGSVSQKQLELYSRLAAGGVGLIITGNFAVTPDGRTDDRLGIMDDSCDMSALSALSGVIKSSGCAAVAQISHAGARSRLHPDAAVYQGMTAFDCGYLKELSEKFGESAAIAKKCGFDGIQLHCAHGYLLSCFLDPAINQRTDEFGGSLVGRLHFPLMCLESVQRYCGNFPVMVKINAVSENPALNSGVLSELPQILHAFSNAGVVFAEISGVDFRKRHRKEHCYYLDACLKLQNVSSVPFTAVGGIRNLDDMAAIFNTGASMISMCRPLICQPELPLLLYSGSTETSSCRGCCKCFTLPLESGKMCAFQN